MEKRPSKLRFDEDDPVGGLSVTPEKKAKTKSKLKRQSAANLSTGAKLKFDQSEKTSHSQSTDASEPGRGNQTKQQTRQQAKQQTQQEVKQKVKHKTSQSKSRTYVRGTVSTATGAAAGTVHREVSKYEDENVGIQAGHRAEKSAEGAAHTVSHAFYSHRLKQEGEAQRLVHEHSEANAAYHAGKKMADETGTATNPLSRRMQRRRIKRKYAEARRAAQTAAAAGSAARAGVGVVQAGEREARAIGRRVVKFVKNHKLPVTAIVIGGGLVAVILCVCSSCTAVSAATGGAILGSSYTAEDEDILAVDADYTAMEVALQNRINRIESDYPDYDEYRYSSSEIGHNPFELASYLTVVYEDYTEAAVQDELQRLFDLQYELNIEESVEIRTVVETGTRTVTEFDPATGQFAEHEEEYEEEVEYEYRILNVTLNNRSLGSVIGSLGLTEDQMSRYAILTETCGNREYLFEDNIYAVSSDYEIYEIPPEALTDEKFARMIAEAEKYLGYPYVWGGSSPSTGFDCSGYVSWVINNCGNGWSVGRQTANGLRNLCTAVSPSEAKPGDLVFFQGTYATGGASHVGIYVGNGMMIHCGNPIQYTSIETSYWQSHFLSYGRLP